MTDYPFPESRLLIHYSFHPALVLINPPALDYPLYLPSSLWGEYYKSYAEQFDLYPHIQLNVSVETIQRDKSQNKWAVYLRGESQPRLFDKIVMAAGTEHTPVYPEIPGQSLFKGQFLHAQSYKNPLLFADKTVLVVGQGATAGDTCVVWIPLLLW